MSSPAQMGIDEMVQIRTHYWCNFTLNSLQGPKGATSFLNKAKHEYYFLLVF